MPLLSTLIWGKKNDLSSVKSKRDGIFDFFSNRNSSCFDDEIIKSDLNSYTFLNFCHLCHKPLRGIEIYMYRGEMGFCSDECRNRQMYLDDMKKIEISTRKILASFRERRRNRCEGGGVGRLRDVPAAAPPLFHVKLKVENY